MFDGMTINQLEVFLGKMQEEVGRGAVAETIHEMRRIRDTAIAHAEFAEHWFIGEMEREGATELLHKTLVVRIKNGPLVVDRGRYHALMEHIPREALIQDGAFIPEHEASQTVPEKWDKRVINGYRRLGTEVKAIIDGAESPGRRSLELREKASDA